MRRIVPARSHVNLRKQPRVAKVTIAGDDDAIMDSARALPKVANSVHPANPGAPREKRSLQLGEILSAILGHESLSLTMQRIADAFVALYPSKGIAIFLGPVLHIEAEAGLPGVPRGVYQMPGARTTGDRGAARTLGRVAGPESNGDPVLSCPAFREILESGVKLCLTSPLNSASGEARGVIAVFDSHHALADDAARETVRSLCDLARLALEHRELYEEVVHRSQHDRLTGLPNRLLLEDRLRQAMVIGRRQGTLVGVCSIDLDHFKPIIDSLGHGAGDVFFKLVSERLLGSIREIDTLARQGGDEFILVLRDLAEIADATHICNRVLKDLSAPFMLEGHSQTIAAS